MARLPDQATDRLAYKKWMESPRITKYRDDLLFCLLTPQVETYRHHSKRFGHPCELSKIFCPNSMFTRVSFMVEVATEGLETVRSRLGWGRKKKEREERAL